MDFSLLLQLCGYNGPGLHEPRGNADKVEARGGGEETNQKQTNRKETAQGFSFGDWAEMSITFRIKREESK